MVKDDEHLLDNLNRALQILHRHINLLSEIGPGLVNVINFVDIKSAGVWSELRPDLLIDFNASARLEILHRVTESVRIGGCGSIVEPSDALEADSAVNDFDVELLTRAIMESLVLHEDHVTHFQTSDKVLD